LNEVHSEIVSSLREVNGKMKYFVDGFEKDLVVVMDGPSFTHFNTEDKEQKAKLLEIGKNCRSVIGCRLTPVQKQQVVNVVKKGTKPRAITLAIGGYLFCS
jgi:phospholipid-translocating ATPase